MKLKITMESQLKHIPTTVYEHYTLEERLAQET